MAGGRDVCLCVCIGVRMDNKVEIWDPRGFWALVEFCRISKIFFLYRLWHWNLICDTKTSAHWVKKLLDYLRLIFCLPKSRHLDWLGLLAGLSVLVDKTGACTVSTIIHMEIFFAFGCLYLHYCLHDSWTHSHTVQACSPSLMMFAPILIHAHMCLHSHIPTFVFTLTFAHTHFTCRFEMHVQCPSHTPNSWPSDLH